MTDKELRHLSRSELLQMLISQMKENQQLRAQLADADEKLRSRRIAISKTGSIAEASLQLNGVFEAAQAAAAQYLENIRMLDQQRNERTAQIEREARAQADEILAEAKEYSRHVHASADEYYRQMHEKAQRMLKDQDALVEWILADERKQKDEAQQNRGKGMPQP